MNINNVCAIKRLRSRQCALSRDRSSSVGTGSQVINS